MRASEAVISFMLGCFLGLTVCPLVKSMFVMGVDPSLSKLGFFLSSYGLYHFAEFMFKQKHYYYDLTWHDFQLDHSVPYMVAMVMCLSEHSAKRLILKHLSQDGLLYTIVQANEES